MVADASRLPQARARHRPQQGLRCLGGGPLRIISATFLLPCINIRHITTERWNRRTGIDGGQGHALMELGREARGNDLGQRQGQRRREGIGEQEEEAQEDGAGHGGVNGGG